MIAKELREIGAQTDATDAAEANSLDRMEFMQCLVRVADLACLKTQLAPDIAAAVGMLLQETVAPVILKAFKFALSRPQVYTNIFRRLVKDTGGQPSASAVASASASASA